MPLTTQNFLEAEEIKEGILVLKRKRLRSILLVSSLNFALKSEEEQSAIIYQFQNFLNSLDFSCQILVHSRKLNIIGYLEMLDEKEKREKNELLKIQIKEYRKFIEGIMKEGSITHKLFYVIVPFVPGEADVKTAIKSSGKMTDENFQRYKTQLLQRTEFIMLGLRSCGLKSALLNSLEIAELLWALHHPEESEKGFYPEIPPEMIK